MDPDGGDWRLQNGSPCIDRGTPVSGLSYNGTAPDMGAWESAEGSISGASSHTPLHLYVDTTAALGGDGLSWDKAFPTLNKALWICSVSDEIWVAKGTYHEAIHMEQGTSLIGGFNGSETDRGECDWVANPTILDATGLGCCVVTVDNSNGTTLAGLTITGSDSFMYGGGVSYNGVASATLTHCTVTGNLGGGMSCGSSTVIIMDCLLTRNTSSDYGGGVSGVGSSVVLARSTISGNTSQSGGGVCLDYYSSLTLEDCTIANNTTELEGGGVFGLDNSVAMLTRCTVSGNTSKYGGGLSWYSDDPLDLKSCLIADNTSEYGGAVYCISTSPIQLTNCTLSGNEAGQNGDGMYFYSSPPIITNSILWNPGDELYLYEPARSATVTYSCVEGGHTGTANIDSDPRFVDAAYGDYHLQASSPCIGKGIGPALNSLVPLLDIDGDPRSGSTCDIGADEIINPSGVRDWMMYE